MSTSQLRVVAALLWSVGLRSAAPPVLTGEEQRLFLRALSAHKCTGRYLARVSPLDPGDSQPVPRELAVAAHRERMDIVTGIEDDARWLAERLDADPDWDGSEIVVLKGNAASYFLADPKVRRHTGDLDLIVADPDRLQRSLEKLGYLSSGSRFCHEAVNLQHPARCEVDVHLYFPVWRYPPGPYHELISGSRHRRMTDWVTSGRLEHHTLLETSIPHPQLPVGNVRVPGLTMTAFVLALHVFHDYVAPALVQPLAKVRLVELCELSELAALDGFDAELFTGLVERHGAQDALSLCVRLLREAGAPLGKLAGVPVVDRDSYPQEIGFGLVVDARTPLADLVVRSDTLDAVLDALDAPEVRLDQGSLTLSTRPGAGREVAVLRSTPSAHPRGDFDFDCTLTRTAEHLTFELVAAGAPGKFFDEFVLFLGNEIVHAAYDVYRSDFRNPPADSGASAAWQLRADGWTVTVQVPLDTLERHRTPGGAIPLVLQAGRFLEELNDSWDDFYRRSVSSSCLPLRLILNGVDS